MMNSNELERRCADLLNGAFTAGSERERRLNFIRAMRLKVEMVNRCIGVDPVQSNEVAYMAGMHGQIRAFYSISDEVAVTLQAEGQENGVSAEKISREQK